jgi:hypothetical protein
MDGFLALDPRVAIVRHETLPAPASLPLTSGPLKVIAALASAEGLPQLDLSKEQSDLKAAFEWDVILKYDVLGKKYQVVRVVNKKAESLGEYPGAAEAEGAAEAPYKVAIALPKKGERGYYNLLLDVETLSLSDLDEVQRWLRGELKPAVSGKKNPGTALGRGVRTLVVRLLGGEKRHYEARTGKFRP